MMYHNKDDKRGRGKPAGGRKGGKSGGRYGSGKKKPRK